MQNTLKRIVICLLVVAICCGFALFAVACDKKQSNKDYVVKVLDESGTAVTSGTGPNGELFVQFCASSDEGDGACSVKKAVGQDGSVTFKASEMPDGTRYHVVLSNLPKGYVYDKTADNTYVSAPGTVPLTLKAPTTFCHKRSPSGDC